MELHFPGAQSVYDGTWGKGTFWKDCRDLRVVGGDIQSARAKTLVADVTNLPLKDRIFDVGVIDLPFMHGKGKNAGAHTFRDFGDIKNQAAFVRQTIDGAVELQRVTRLGFIVKCKDIVESGTLRLSHVDVIIGIQQELAVKPADIAVYVPPVVLANDPKWGPPKHFRRQESYFLVYRK